MFKKHTVAMEEVNAKLRFLIAQAIMVMVIMIRNRRIPPTIHKNFISNMYMFNLFFLSLSHNILVVVAGAGSAENDLIKHII